MEIVPIIRTGELPKVLEQIGVCDALGVRSVCLTQRIEDDGDAVYASLDSVRGKFPGMRVGLRDTTMPSLLDSIRTLAEKGGPTPDATSIKLPEALLGSVTVRDPNLTEVKDELLAHFRAEERPKLFGLVGVRSISNPWSLGRIAESLDGSIDVLTLVGSNNEPPDLLLLTALKRLLEQTKLAVGDCVTQRNAKEVLRTGVDFALVERSIRKGVDRGTKGGANYGILDPLELSCLLDIIQAANEHPPDQPTPEEL